MKNQLKNVFKGIHIFTILNLTMIYTDNRSVNTDDGGRSKVATGTIHGFRGKTENPKFLKSFFFNFDNVKIFTIV